MLTTKTEIRRQTILVLDNANELEQLIKEPLQKHLEKMNVSALLVRAKDGADAARKTENQKFDVVIIDTEVPRLMDGGFVHGMRTYKNTSEAQLIVISQKDRTELPVNLQTNRHFKKPYEPAAIVESMIATVNEVSGLSGLGHNKFAVDVRVINAVIKATSDVLGKFGVSSLTMDKAAPRSVTECLAGEVSAVIEIKSTPFRGLLTISFDKDSFLEIASTMLMSEETEINSENQDAAGELVNIIYGNAKADLAAFGVEMTTPKVLIGGNQNVQCPGGSAAMSIPFRTKKGRLYLTVIATPV